METSKQCEVLSILREKTKTRIMEPIVDFLEIPIIVGDRAIRVHSYSHSKSFKKVTVMEIDATRKYGDIVGIITDGNSRIGWTYPHRIIVQESFKVKL